MLAVLLRNCTHGSGSVASPDDATNADRIRYALKCDTFSIQLAKTPIQIPIPQQSPELIDLGIFRPSISIGGLVDTVGQDTTTTGVSHADLYENMEYIDISRNYWDDTTARTKANRYYIPTKNILEELAYTWIASDSTQLELEVGDANVPVYGRWPEPDSDGDNAESSGADETGGGIYIVAIQQARFQIDPGTEDRWTFQMQFVCESRKDVTF